MQNVSRSNWIESAGGPLLFTAKANVHAWKGDQSSSVPGEPTDYQRACAVTDEIGTIKIADAIGVVLGDEPDRTCIASGSDDLIIIRWRWAESEAELLSAVYSRMAELHFSNGQSFSTTPGDHIMFDAVYAASEIDESLCFRLHDKEYRLETALLQVGKETCALLHRLKPL